MSAEVHEYEEVNIRAGKTTLSGELCVPRDAKAVIVFSHGSGSSRFSRRNRKVAAYLNDRNFGTLLLDLLTPDEDIHFRNRFDIELLGKRLVAATNWLAALPAAKDCRFGFFGASTGAASALQAAAELPYVDAVVSRGGRPDLASLHSLQTVHAAVLLIVGSLDVEVLQLNRKAFQQLKCAKEISIVDGASHLFEEPGKMDEVSRMAALWFEKYLVRAL